MACYSWSKCLQITIKWPHSNSNNKCDVSLHCSQVHSRQVLSFQNGVGHQISFHIEHTRNAINMCTKWLQHTVQHYIPLDATFSPGHGWFCPLWGVYMPHKWPTPYCHSSEDNRGLHHVHGIYVLIACYKNTVCDLIVTGNSMAYPHLRQLKWWGCTTWLR